MSVVAYFRSEQRRSLSGAPTGAGIKVTSTSSAVTVHAHNEKTDPSYPGVKSVFDEIHLWALNSHSASVTVTVRWGGSTDPDNLLPIAIQPGSFLKIVNGMHIAGDLTVSAVASVVNKIVLYGYVLSHIREVAEDPAESG